MSVVSQVEVLSPLQELIAALVNPVVVLDGENRVVAVNSAGEQLFSIPRLGCGVSEVSRLSSSPVLHELLRRRAPATCAITLGGNQHFRLQLTPLAGDQLLLEAVPTRRAEPVTRALATARRELAALQAALDELRCSYEQATGELEASELERQHLLDRVHQMLGSAMVQSEKNRQLEKLCAAVSRPPEARGGRRGQNI